MTAQEWEDAWEDLVAAEERLEAARPDRHKPRHVLVFKRARRAVALARKRLKDLDPEFCERLGVED